ncbi:MAG: GNAT family N-acetyltransferase [Anaerolineae bacterium]|nr:GNAT family N-acetyltransferase [Anaerolineae bacterium]
MDRPPIRGDEVRQGKFIYLDAVSDAVRDTLGDDPLPESLLYQLVEDDRPIAPMTARQVYQTYKDAGELGFALRLSTDKTCIGFCRLGHVSWQARQAQLMVALVREDCLTLELLADVIQTVLQFAYWEANLNRVYADCSADHTLMQAALVQAGFTHEGCLRQEVYRDGRYLDKCVYSILAREWLSRDQDD